MLARAFVAIAACLLAGCSALYFQPAAVAPGPVPRYPLDHWPDRDYWTGLVFNGEKIGFSHLALGRAPTPGLYELRSETAFALRFLGYDKRVTLKAVDVVREDLDLVSFRYDYLLDGSALALAGERRGSQLIVRVDRGGEQTEVRLAAPARLHPQAAIALLPGLTGLETGRELRYAVFSGELQKVSAVHQRIAGYERSDLFAGEAYRVETAMEGFRVETWISPRGAPLLEIGLNGVLIAGLEDETRARGYLAAASLNKAEALVGFALARPEEPLEAPRRVTLLRLALSGSDRDVPSDRIQACAREADATVCTVRTAGTNGGGAPDATTSAARYLAPSFAVPARHPVIARQAAEIAAGAMGDGERVRRILDWIGANVRLSPADVWSALDVLEKREAECQGHAYLYAALARALGVPTRVVNGIVYSEEHGGFLFHTWAESAVSGHWLAVDPTFRAAPADATHVKLVEGEALADLVPLADWVGKLRVRILAVAREGDGT